MRYYSEIVIDHPVAEVFNCLVKNFTAIFFDLELESLLEIKQQPDGPIKVGTIFTLITAKYASQEMTFPKVDGKRRIKFGPIIYDYSHGINTENYQVVVYELNKEITVKQSKQGFTKTTNYFFVDEGEKALVKCELLVEDHNLFSLIISLICSKLLKDENQKELEKLKQLVGKTIKRV